MEWQSVEDFLIQMKKFFEGVDEVKANLLEGIQFQDLKKTDLEHDLELGKLNAGEMAKLAKTLKGVLQEKRIYKDELSLVQCLKDDLVDKYNKKLITGDIVKALKDLRELRGRLNNRKYTPRVIENLKCVEGTKDENNNTINDTPKEE